MMNTLRLIGLALKYHWDAQKSNPANLFAGTFGMIVNNLIILWGLWAMLFDGKPDGQALTIYFLSLNAVVTISWGAINFLFGGLRFLGEYIEEGSLEPMLATPRDPLILVAISKNIMPALGDVIQGLGNLIVLFFVAPFAMAGRCVVFTFVAAVAVLGLYILIGSIPFFVRRGNTLAQLLLECNLSLSFYPSSKVFSDHARIFLYLTPAAFTGVLPMDAVERGTWPDAVLAVLGTGIFLWAAIRVFRYGLRRYQSSNYVMVRG
jgi:ABC-2 type transport system permease protein